MAELIGEPSRNAAEESFKKTRRLVVVLCVSITVLGMVLGYIAGSFLPYRSLPVGWALAVIFALTVIVVWISRWGCDQIDLIDRERMA